MGWISDFFGYGDPDPVETISQSNVPDFVTNYSQDQLELAGNLGLTPYSAYPGQGVADLSGDENRALDLIRSNEGNWRDPLSAASGAATGVMNERFPTADINAYMNPYRNALNPAINRAYDEQAVRDASNATMTGAFGGNRRGIVEGTTGARRAESLANVDREAFMNAQDMWRGDQQSRLAGVGALSALTEQQQKLGAADVAGLASGGALQRGNTQQNIDYNRGQFEAERQYPFDMFNLRQSALSGLPYSTSGTSYTTGGAQPNAFATNVGALGGLVSGVGGFFAKDKGGTSAWDGMLNAKKTIWG